MAVCPSCGEEYEEGVLECPKCRAALEGLNEPLNEELLEALSSPAVEPDSPAPAWVPIYSGHGPALDLLEDDLRGRGFEVARTPAEDVQSLPAGVVGAQDPYFRLSVPATQYQARHEEVAAALVETTGGSASDPEAMAEAEEDYDLRGCPECRVYFHSSHTACPGCGKSLVPAVEVFDEGQLEPDAVVLRHGTAEEMQPLAARLQGAGFNATVDQPAGWPVSVLCLPWPELTDRTRELEALAYGVAA
jgi:hypothetical protein